MRIGIRAAIGLALLFFPVASLAQDADWDGIPDVLDKCMLDSRNVVLSCDTDCDGYGNVCDGDFNQNGETNSVDYVDWFVPFFTPNPPPVGTNDRGQDMNCSGGDILPTDYTMFFVPNWIEGAPGPSGLACAGVPGCC